MHDLRIQDHLLAIIRDETYPIDRHLRFLRNEPWQGHANDVPVKPIQYRVHTPIGLPIRLRESAVEEHQLECIETDRQVKKLILLTWCAAIIADHDNLSELLQCLTGLPSCIGKQRSVGDQFLCEMQCLGRS